MATVCLCEQLKMLLLFPFCINCIYEITLGKLSHDGRAIIGITNYVGFFKLRLQMRMKFPTFFFCGVSQFVAMRAPRNL